MIASSALSGSPPKNVLFLRKGRTRFRWQLSGPFACQLGSSRAQTSPIRLPVHLCAATRLGKPSSRSSSGQIPDKVDERSADGAANLPGLGSVLGLRTQFGYPLPMGNDLAAFLDLSYYQQLGGR